MDFNAGLKSLVIKAAPPSVLQYVKKRYYLEVTRRQKESDEPEFKVFKALIRAGETVIDVGANVGLFTHYFSHLVGERGLVHSIEPIPRTYEILSNTVEKLRVRNVRLWNFAASDRDGTAVMEIPTYEGRVTPNFYRARIVANVTEAIVPRRVQVDLRSLDGLAEIRSRTPSLLKIDVEGHELQVIKGARRLISLSKPCMLIEVSGNLDDPTSSAAELSGILEREGYKPYWLERDQLKVRRKGVESVNYFYLTREHLVRATKFLEDSPSTSLGR